MSGSRVSTFSEFAGKPTSEVKFAETSAGPKKVEPQEEEELADFLTSLEDEQDSSDLVERADLLLEKLKEERRVQEEIVPINESLVPKFEGYRIARDKDEVFECKISVEGTTLNEARARLVLDSEPWNLTFYGKIHTDGHCTVPIKKGLPLGEGSTGKIRLEVIAEDQLFVGWENEFLVEVSKKLSVEVKEQKKVKVSFDSVG